MAPARSNIVLNLRVLEGRYAVVRIDAGAVVPAALREADGIVSITRTGDELSILCPEAFAAPFEKVQRGLCAIKVDQPLDFAMTGVLASLAGPLADAGVPIFVVSTFDTDYVLVPGEKLAVARDALVAAGHTFDD
jgi:hypothetical protein